MKDEMKLNRYDLVWMVGAIPTLFCGNLPEYYPAPWFIFWVGGIIIMFSGAVMSREFDKISKSKMKGSEELTEKNQ